jgi:hypothetical protein
MITTAAIIIALGAIIFAYRIGRQVQYTLDQAELERCYSDHMENVGRLGNLQKRLESASQLCTDIEKNLADHQVANEQLMLEIEALMPKSEPTSPKKGLRLVN